MMIKFRWKFIGALLGLVLAGPLGMIFGVAIGHNFDTGIDNTQPDSNAPPAKFNQNQWQLLIRTAFQLMGHIAKSDGRVSEQEITAAEKLMDHWQLTAEQRRYAIKQFNIGRNTEHSLEDILLELRQSDHPPGLRRYFIDAQLTIAYAEGDITPYAQSLLYHVRNRLKFPRWLFESLEILAQGRSRHYASSPPPQQKLDRELSAAYQTLQVPPTCRPAEITQAYRRMINRYHPDKLASTQHTKDAIAQATEQTRNIKAAYERIRLARGF